MKTSALWLLTVMMFAACAPPQIGCYSFEWVDYGDMRPIPMWLTPDGVRLESTRAPVDGWYAVGPMTAPVEVDRGNGATESTWDALLYDRMWTSRGDSIFVRLKDLAYNRWDIALVRADAGWSGTATYTTSMGGAERSFTGPIQASRCQEN